MRVLLLLSLLFLPAAAPAFDPRTLQWEALEALRGQLGTCRDRRLDPTGMHVPDAHRELVHLLGGMLEMDPGTCPGVAAAAAADIRRRIGTPERADIDLALLALAWQAAERGQGMAADPALADRYGRLLWLFTDDAPALPHWPEAARQAWLKEPATILLLRARTASPATSTRRARELLGETLLDRSLPSYDPVAAIALLENCERPLRASGLLTDGVHVPVDYPRAARRYFWLAGTPPGTSNAQMDELIRIGRLAAASARTPVARAEALRILFIAGTHDHSPVARERAALLAAIGWSPTVRLAAGDAERIARALNWHFAFALPDADLGGAPRGSPPTLLRGLVGPDGRMTEVEVVRPSRARRSDEALVEVWAERGGRVDLGATARGRFVWVALPPVDPGLDTLEAQERWGEPDLD